MIATARPTPYSIPGRLSVEEQFYVLFPLVIFAIWKFSHRARVSAISIIALASFLYAAYMVYADASAAFYLVQFRAWELAVGSLLQLMPCQRSLADGSRRSWGY